MELLITAGFSTGLPQGRMAVFSIRKGNTDGSQGFNSYYYYY